MHRELEMESPVVLEMKGKSTLLRKTTDDVIVGQTREKVNEFVYDYSYWSLDPSYPHFVPQEQVFNDLGKTVLEAAFEGYNACVFAYGQTGSGKTFTMMGTERAPGLIPRICETLFDRTVSGSLKKVSYKVEASFMEIYNEMVRDLLLPAHKYAANRLKVRQHPKHGPYVES
ncbi:Kinesin-like protein Klp98A, partial [Geodia barretti]